MAPPATPRTWVPLLMAATLAAIGLWLLLDGGAPQSETPARADPASVYDPVAAGEDLPRGYRVGLPRDQITPVYEPSFAAARAVDWPDDSLVIGVAGAETAKAYPVTHLNSHEMVVDSLEGIPILVTW